MRLAYADPPYVNCAHLYKEQPEYNGEIDYPTLIKKIETEYDGYVLHASSPSIPYLTTLLAPETYRIMAWIKPFAAFKKNVSVAYAWEPVFVKPVRKPVVSGRVIMRDWFPHSITMKKGLTGVKPAPVVEWVLEMAGMEHNDDLDDLYPGTGAVSAAWEAWKIKLLLGVIHERSDKLETRVQQSKDNLQERTRSSSMEGSMGETLCLAADSLHHLWICNQYSTRTTLRMEIYAICSSYNH